MSALNQTATGKVAAWGCALWLPDYLRRDATAQSLLLLSMFDITSSFL